MDTPIKHPDKLLVEVKGNRYECYGDPTNVTAALLMKTLKDMGGISDSVPEGYYWFSADIVMGMLRVNLAPYTEES